MYGAPLGRFCFEADRLKSRRRKAVNVLRAIAGATLLTILGATLSPPVRALPSFARQTGQPCGTCHTDFPGLTPYGRLFKLNGYTAGGGPYRKTLFSSQDDPTRALAAYAKGATANADPSQPNTKDIWVPPISMMAIVGYTNTQVSQPASSPYKPNDNIVVPHSAFSMAGRSRSTSAPSHKLHITTQPSEGQRLALSTLIPAQTANGPGITSMCATPTLQSWVVGTSSTGSPPTTIRASRIPGTQRLLGDSRTPRQR